jgi:hypothetical protein
MISVRKSGKSGKENAAKGRLEKKLITLSS